MSTLTISARFEGGTEQLLTAKVLLQNVPGLLGLMGELSFKLEEGVAQDSVLSTSIRTFFRNPRSDSSDPCYERIVTCCRRSEIHTIGDLIRRSEEDLLAITNFGPRMLQTVEDRLADEGLKLRPS